MIFNFDKKKELKSLNDLLKALGAKKVDDTELIFEFDTLINLPSHNYVDSLDQKNSKLISNNEYRFESYNKNIHKEFNIGKLKYLLWLGIMNEKAIGGYGSRNVNVEINSNFPKITFNLNVTEDIITEILDHFKKNNKINFVFGLIKYNKENCKLYNQNYYEYAENNNLIITRFKIY